MRILLDHLDPLLADALTALLTRAGHEVLEHGRAPAPDLTVRLHPPEPGTVVDGPLLCLRPIAQRPVPSTPGTGEERPREPAAPDPAQALRLALAGGPPAVWEPPLDPGRLLSVLGSLPEPAPSTGPVAGLFASAAAPWFRLTSAHGRLEPLNAEARAVLAGTARGPGRAAPAPSPAVLAAVRAADQGCWFLESEPGVEAFALWWTPHSGERLLGWVPWSRVQQAEDRGTLRALAELGRISSTFAHEVRNPLAALVSALDLLRGPLEEGDRAEVITLAQARVGHLRQLLDDTLRLVRSFRGPPTAVDLAEVLDSARALARSDPLFAGIEVVLEAPSPVPQPLSYAEPLRQALTNLLINAAHAQGHRGVLRIVVEPRDRRVCVAVLDQGPGIPAEQRQKVFEPFWTTKAQGTGLGLAFVRRLAEASGGRAWAVPTPPPGARVEIELPLA